MVERSPKPFSSTRVSKAMERPPLSNKQIEVFNAAIAYSRQHKGKKIRQILLAQELGMDRRALVHHVRKIFEKGYKAPILTSYQAKLTPERLRRLKRLTEREELINQIERLRLAEHFTGPQILVRLSLSNPNITQNQIDGILQFLRTKGRIPRVREPYRTKSEIEVLKERIRARRIRNIPNKIIAKELGISRGYLEDLERQMFLAHNLEKRPLGWRKPKESWL